MAFELPQLPYASNALEPNIDAQTMEIHHGRHHKAYVDNLNNAVLGTEAEGKTIEEIIAKLEGGGEDDDDTVDQVDELDYDDTLEAPNDPPTHRRIRRGKCLIL
jgi:superoxide dismutase